MKVFENIKNNDIFFGGEENLSIQRNVYPFLNQNNANEVKANKYLLLQFEFYIYHVCYCYKRLVAGDTENQLLLKGYTVYEVVSAKKARKENGDNWNTNTYLYISTARIGLIARTIEKIERGESVDDVSKDIIDSAYRRIQYAKKGTEHGTIREALT